MRASYDGSTHIVNALLNAGAKTDLQSKVLLVHFDFEIGMYWRQVYIWYVRCTTIKVMVLWFGLASTFISICTDINN